MQCAYSYTDDLCRLVLGLYSLHVRVVDIFVICLILNLYDSMYNIIFVNIIENLSDIVRACVLS